MANTLLDDIKKLSIPEKILLVEEIWDDIADSAPDALSLTDEQHAELDRRIKSYEAGPGECRCWNEIKKDYRRGGR